MATPNHWLSHSNDLDDFGDLHFTKPPDSLLDEKPGGELRPSSG